METIKMYADVDVNTLRTSFLFEGFESDETFRFFVYEAKYYGEVITGENKKGPYLVVKIPEELLYAMGGLHLMLTRLQMRASKPVLIDTGYNRIEKKIESVNVLPGTTIKKEEKIGGGIDVLTCMPRK